MQLLLCNVPNTGVVNRAVRSRVDHKKDVILGLLPPEVRYTLWRHNESKQRSSALLQAGSWQPTWNYDASAIDSIPPETTPTAITHAYKLDYSTAVVDPVDDATFWTVLSATEGHPATACEEVQVRVLATAVSDYRRRA